VQVVLASHSRIGLELRFKQLHNSLPFYHKIANAMKNYRGFLIGETKVFLFSNHCDRWAIC